MREILSYVFLIDHAFCVRPSEIANWKNPDIQNISKIDAEFSLALLGPYSIQRNENNVPGMVLDVDEPNSLP